MPRFHELSAGLAGLVLLVATALAATPARAQSWNGATLVGGDYCHNGAKDLGMAFKNIRLCPTTDNYVGSIFLSAMGFCPPYTLEAAGQSISVERYVALHALYKTKFGGDGVTNFNLPDLRSAPPVAHNDSKKYLRYCVVVDGVYPSRG